MQLLKKEKFGNNPHKCAIISCVHSNEDAGLKIFNLLKKNSADLNFTLITITITKEEKSKKSMNLNRLFNLPSCLLMNKSKESSLARKLHKEMMKYELVIDIHSTNFKTPPYWIVVNLTPLIEKIIMLSNISNVLILNYKNSLISIAKDAVGIEIGDNNDKKNIINAYKNLESILLNFEEINTGNFKKRKLNYFVHIGEFKKDFIDRLNKKIKDFQLIRQDILLGYKANRKVYSPLGFYPLWTRKDDVDKKYPIMCHILKRLNDEHIFK